MILFPVFARARENGRRTSCLSNLKQLGLATMQYTQDYDERLPTSGDNSEIQVRIWDRLVSYTKNNQIFVCPSTLLVRSDSWVYGRDINTGATVRWDTSYGYNYNYLQDYSHSTGSVHHWIGVNLAQIKDPAQTVAIADTNAPTIESIEPPASFYRTWGHKGYLDERHLDGLNVLWLDGHAKWTKLNSLLTPASCAPIADPNSCDNALWDRE